MTTPPKSIWHAAAEHPDESVYLSVEPRQILNWAKEALALTELLAEDRPTSWALTGMFWIRLVGLGVDVPSAIRQGIGESLGATEGNPARQEALDAVEAVLRPLPDDEAFYVVYMRHCATHPVQSHYRERQSKLVRSPVLASPVTQLESEKMLRGVLVRHEVYGLDETPIARHVARSVLAAVRSANQKLIALFSTTK